MTNSQAKSELMQLYMSLSEEKKQALDVLMAQAEKTCDIEKSNFDVRQYKLDTDTAYECGYNAGLQAQADGEYIRRSDVIKAVDKHTIDTSEIVLDEDITVILEELPSVAIPSAEPRYYPPCEDCHKKMNEIRKAYDKIPSAEPKTGQWIMEDMFDGDVAYRCSECNELFWIESGTPKDNGYDFCPKCGKRLVEPQERSE